MEQSHYIGWSLSNCYTEDRIVMQICLIAKHVLRGY